MSDDREARVEELFARAVVLPRAERRTFIEKHCDDPGVRAEVEVLLGYDDDRERLVGVFPTASSEPSALPPRSPSPSSPSSPASVDYGRFMPGSVVAGRYRIAGLLGRGGVGEVYRADDLKLGQAVALKFLPEELARDPRILERFHSEVRLARQVSHPGVCRVHDIGEVGEQHFLSMEYIDGEDLASLLKRIGRFSREKALEVAHQLCLGVEAAHRKGVIHRDLKPANVMFDGRGRVVITDFGLAGIADEIPRSDIRAGTPSYMSPEQIEGKEVTTRSDIYALGLILYEVFTGEAAFDALPIRGLSRSHKDSTPRTPSSVVDDVPAEVEGIILRCLERDPESRPASALEVATALPGGDPLGLALAAGDTPTPEMVAASGRIAESRVGVICAALAFVAIGLAVIALTFRGTSLVGLADLPDPPPVLAGAARDLIAALGHESSLAFEAYGLEIDETTLDRIERERVPGEAADVTGAMRFWYRGRPDGPFAARFAYPDRTGTRFKVSPVDPAPTVAGMAGIYLDMSGRLRSFSLVPVSDATRTAPGSGGESTGADAADGGDAWEPLFTAAALDREALREARPVTVPPVPSDRRIAWVRTGEGEDDGFRVEAASFEGAPVWFTVLPSGPLDPAKAAPRAPAAFLFGLGFCIAVLIAAAFLVRHNLRSGRGDRRGAFRLAVVVFWLNMLRWLFHCDHVATIDELGLFFNGLARAVALAFAVWLFYLALEPYVRRRWPQTIVSWSRAISGRLRDPLVGRDLLFGAAAGVALGLLERLEAIVPRWLSLPAAPVSRTLDARSLRTLLGVPDMLGELFHVARDAISVSFILLLALLLLRVIVRHRVIAFTLYIVVLTVIFRNATLRVDAGWFFDFAKALLGAALLVRLGVVAHVAAVLVYILVTAYPLTADVSAWYAGAGLFAAAVTLALAAFGFHVALAGRPLLRDELLQN